MRAAEDGVELLKQLAALAIRALLLLLLVQSEGKADVIGMGQLGVDAHAAGGDGDRRCVEDPAAGAAAEWLGHGRRSERTEEQGCTSSYRDDHTLTLSCDCCQC